MLDGGEGNDTANYSSVLTGLEISLYQQVAGVPPISHIYPLDDPRIPDFLIDIENIVGSQGNDLIVGDNGDNRLEGTVTEATFLGNIIDYRVDIGGVTLRVQGDRRDVLAVGARVALAAPVEECTVMRDPG